MASPPSGTSSGSTFLPNSGSEEDLQQVMDQRKKKRKLSNRESARRSRMRKQKHLDDLMAQVGQLRKENNQINTSLNLATHHFLNVEAENTVLNAQINELTTRLQSLSEIIQYLNVNNGFVFEGPQITESFMKPWNSTYLNQPWNSTYLNQPIMASAEMFQY